MIPILETLMMTNIFFSIWLKILAAFWERGLNSELIKAVKKVSGRREGGGEEWFLYHLQNLSSRKVVVDLRAAAYCALDLFLVRLLSPSLCCHEELLWLSSPYLPHQHIQYMRHKIVTRNRLGLPLSKGPWAPDPPLPQRLSLWQVLQAKIEFCGSCSWNLRDSLVLLEWGEQWGSCPSQTCTSACSSLWRMWLLAKKNCFILHEKNCFLFLVYPVFTA